MGLPENAPGPGNRRMAGHQTNVAGKAPGYPDADRNNRLFTDTLYCLTFSLGIKLVPGPGLYDEIQL